MFEHTLECIQYPGYSINCLFAYRAHLFVVFYKASLNNKMLRRINFASISASVFSRYVKITTHQGETVQVSSVKMSELLQLAKAYTLLLKRVIYQSDRMRVQGALAAAWKTSVQGNTSFKLAIIFVLFFVIVYTSWDSLEWDGGRIWPEQCIQEIGCSSHVVIRPLASWMVISAFQSIFTWITTYKKIWGHPVKNLKSLRIIFLVIYQGRSWLTHIIL